MQTVPREKKKEKKKAGLGFRQEERYIKQKQKTVQWRRKRAKPIQRKLSKLHKSPAKQKSPKTSNLPEASKKPITCS